jgi:hypothetical protein
MPDQSKPLSTWRQHSTIPTYGTAVSPQLTSNGEVEGTSQA